MAPLIPVRNVLVIAFCFLLAGSAWGQNQTAPETPEPVLEDPASLPQLHAIGLLRADYFRSSRTVDDETDFYGLTAQLKLLPSFGEYFDGKIEARFMEPDIARGRRTPSSARLLEGFFVTHGNQIDVSIGKQNVAWGRADAINPTDNLTPRDYTILLPFEEDQRFGTTCFRIDARIAPEYTLTFFATPLFEPSRIPLPLPAGAYVQKDNVPPHTFANSEAAIKINKAGGEADWSASYFHGFSLLPEVHLTTVLPPNLLVELRYPEIHAAGADFARNFGSYGFRAEGVYVSPRDYKDDEPTMIKPYLFYVLGIDRTFLENLNLNVQLIGRWVPNFKDPNAVADQVQRAVAVKNAVLFGQQQRASYGFSSRISERWFNDSLEAEVLLVMYFDPANSYFRPLGTFAFTDRIKASIGADIYSGTEDSRFGSIKKNNTVFTELRYTF